LDNLYLDIDIGLITDKRQLITLFQIQYGVKISERSSSGIVSEIIIGRFVDLVIKISVGNERPSHAHGYCRRHGHGERGGRVVRRDLLEIWHLHDIGPIESRRFQTRPQHIVGRGFGIVHDVSCRSVNIHYSVHCYFLLM
jgi:hypothetical protein